MIRRRSVSGFTLVEALTTLVVFGFFLSVLFLTIHWGFRAFSLAVARSDVTTEARRISLFIEQELRGSSYFSIDSVGRNVGSDRRDAICFVSRNDWSAPNAFDQDKGSPNWNRYFLYYSTQSLPSGSLIRAVINPSAAGPTSTYEIGPFPFAGFSAGATNYLKEGPSETYPSEVETARVLATSVKTFEVKLEPVTQNVDLRLLLRQNGVMARRANGVREGGTFELKYLVHPENTL